MTDLFEHQSYDDIIGRKMDGMEEYGKIVKVHITKYSEGNGYKHFPFVVTFEGKPNFWCDAYCYKDAEDVVSRLIPES